MKFINFSNDSPNYRLSDGAMIWNVAPWTLGDDISEIALSSCFLFLDRKISWKPIILNCSLIDANYANYIDYVDYVVYVDYTSMRDSRDSLNYM